MENDQASYYFHEGTNYHAYEYMGCNAVMEKGRKKYSFRTWAPNADAVYLIGEFSSWKEKIPLKKISNAGVWEIIYTPNGNIEGTSYKYIIKNKDKLLYKGDPYAKFSKGGSDGASIIYTKKYNWRDSEWLRERKKRISNSDGYSCPINIYEVHAGSFIRRADGQYYSYRELAEILCGYVKYMGYTHVELLPLAEYPYDGSWGYQVGGFYAPTSRYGTPDDFKYFVETMHNAGIGVILDWVPAHFVKDEWGLFEFDGEPLYEYQGWDRIESCTWGTRFFDVGRQEVQSFLISNAMYLLREFHVDGLRVDAVASMLYLDYDRKDGDWIPNRYGGRENLEAISFLKKLNEAVKSEFQDVLMIAEESGSYGKVTHTPDGLGFDMKWNMGFANDIYEYIALDTKGKAEKHSALTFPLMYAYSEKYILPISHDEVVHGKRSFIDKFYGSYDEKFKACRLTLLMLMSYPGKKLTFMGTEFAQFREWNYSESLEWFMLDFEKHYEMREYVAALNGFYLSNAPLWEFDFEQAGFKWISVDERDKCSVAYKRIDKSGGELIIALNFSDKEQLFSFHDIEAPRLKKVFSTEDFPTESVSLVHNGSAEIKLSPISGAIYKPNDLKIKICL